MLRKPIKEQIAETQRFMEELGRDIPKDERLIVSFAKEVTVQTDDTGKKLNNDFWPKAYDPDAAVDPNTNAYTCISSAIKTPNPKTGRMRYWRSEQNFGHGLALMVDDIGNGKGSKGNMQLKDLFEKLKPTAAIETSPGNFQVWYFLKEPVKEMWKFRSLVTGFAAYALADGGDRTIRDVTRYGRMPIGINNKRVGKERGAAFKYLVEIDGVEKFARPVLVYADYTARYTPEEIAATFGYSLAPPTAKLASVDTPESSSYAQYLRSIDLRLLSICITEMRAAKLGEGSNQDIVKNASGKYRCQCPWGNMHANGDPYGAYFREAIPGAEVEFVFGCAHDTCRTDEYVVGKGNIKIRRGWEAFTEEIAMPPIYQRLLRASLHDALNDLLHDAIQAGQLK